MLLNYLLPRDVLDALEREQRHRAHGGAAAVDPARAIRMARGDRRNLRYFANTGGRMPRETLRMLRRRVPKAQPFLMYGLTEAFRSTYLPPEEVDRRPDSIGKAIPNAEILVLREDGTECAPDEPGELVHRGALVGHGLLERRREDGRALSSRCPLARPGAKPGCSCRRSRSSPATPCARTRRASSISSADATR